MARSFLVITLLPAIFAPIALGAPVQKVQETSNLTKDWDLGSDHAREESTLNGQWAESSEITSQVPRHVHIICKEDHPVRKHKNTRRGNFCVPVTRPSNKEFIQPNHRPALRTTIDPNAPTIFNRLTNVEFVESVDLGEVRAPGVDGVIPESNDRMRLKKRGEEKEETKEEPKKVEEEEAEIAEDDSEDWDAYMEQLILTKKKAEDFRTDEDFALNGKIEWAQDSNGNWKFIKKEE